MTSWHELLPLTPLLILAAGAVLLMLLIAFGRHHQATAQLATLVFAAALLACWYAPGSQTVTPLLSFDNAARSAQALLIFAGLIVTLLLYGYLQGLAEPVEEMYLLLILAVLGGAALAGARHAASLLLGLEIMSVALFGMIAYPRAQRPPLEACAKYLILSAASSATLLFGMALLYAGSGSLLLADWLGPAPDGLTLAGTALLLAGLGFKLSLVPFHLWTPDVYQGAPAPVTATLATVSKGAVVVLLLRLLSGGSPGESLLTVLALLAGASILLGNLLALLSGNVKRLLAYSSIAHLGYLLVPLLLGGTLAAEAVLFYLAAYFVMTLGAFGVVTVLSSPAGDQDAEDFERYRGLFWRRPWLTSVMTPMLLALAGVPLTAGFLAKFYVIAAGVDARAWGLIALVILGSAIGLYFYLRLTIVMFQAPPTGRPAREGRISETSLTAGVALAVLFALVFWWGIWPEDLMHWLARL